MEWLYSLNWPTNPPFQFHWPFKRILELAIIIHIYFSSIPLALLSGRQDHKYYKSLKLNFGIFKFKTLYKKNLN